MRDQGAKLRTTSTRDSGSLGRPGVRGTPPPRGRLRLGSRHTANTADPLPDISAPHGPRPGEALRTCSTAGASANAGSSSRLNSARPTRLRVAGPHRRPQRVAGDRASRALRAAGTRRPSPARPAGTPARSRAAGRRGSGVTTSPRPGTPRGRRGQEERHVRPDGRRNSREFFPCQRQFPDLVQGQRAPRPRRSTRRPARPASGCAW